MSSVASFAGIICAVSIAVSLISLIIPQGNTKRVMNSVIGVFVLCCMIVPVINAVKNFKYDFNIPDIGKNYTASADEAYNKAIIKETARKLESSALNCLLSKGIKAESAVFNLSYNKKSGIYIKRIRIYISKKETFNFSKIISIIENKFEKTPELMVT